MLLLGTLLFVYTSLSRNKTELSIIEAIHLASPSALKWNENAQLLIAINIDLEDRTEKNIGSKGKRKYWNISFGVPDTDQYFLVTIYKGKIEAEKDFSGNGASPYPKEEFMALEDIKYDSPELLKKALKLNVLNPGKDWAKGYSFMILRDAESKTPLLFVIGWNKELNDMVNVAFNVSTGEQLAAPP